MRIATAQEKADFSTRLTLALKKSAHPIKSATDLARLFNRQHRTVSCIGISVQTAHKWLHSRAIPSADQIQTLAKWLEVSEHWLRYGPPPNESALQNAEQRLP